MVGSNYAVSYQLYRPLVCISFNVSGFDVRLGVYELITVESGLRDLIRSDGSEDAIQDMAFAEHDTLFRNAARYIKTGQTSVEEVLRVCRREEER